MSFWTSLLTTLGLAADGKPKVRRDPRWPACRARHLARQPTCQACGSRENLEVHHVRPVHTHPDLELSPDNLITLCEGPVVNDHILFGHLHNWKSWNPSVRFDAALWLEKIKDRPTQEGA